MGPPHPPAGLLPNDDVNRGMKTSSPDHGGLVIETGPVPLTNKLCVRARKGDS